MNKTLLKELVLASYKNGKLNASIVAKIAEKLNRSQLKEYIKALKKAEKLNNVYIESPITNGALLTQTFKDMFGDKFIKASKNSSLIAGVKINYNDDVFEISVKNNLDKIINSIREDYD